MMSFCMQTGYSSARLARPMKRDRQIADTELQALLAAIEQEYVEGDVEVRNLIFVSFLESLPTPGEEAYLLRTRLGPHLAKALEQLWRPHPAT